MHFYRVNTKILKLIKIKFFKIIYLLLKNTNKIVFSASVALYLTYNVRK